MRHGIRPFAGSVNRGGVMVVDAASEGFTYRQRLGALRATKLEQTRQKQELVGSMDYDDWGIILPPPDRREMVETISGSGVAIRDFLLAGFSVESNHESGGFFGPEICGRNYRFLLESHPTYIDPESSLAGGYMVNFLSYRKPHWHPLFPIPSHIQEAADRYRSPAPIGGLQHFCQDHTIGLGLGWGGILEKIRHFRSLNPPTRHGFYDGLEHIVLGLQDWIHRHAQEARRMADGEALPWRRDNLLSIADANDHLETEPPRTFREACQWILWFQLLARMYNGSGSLGRLDLLLLPYYERDRAAGTLTDDEAAFHIACMLLRETGYIQLGGVDEDGRDNTNAVSFLVLEAAHLLGVPANVGIAVGKDVNSGLLRRGVEVMLGDRKGIPKFLGVDNTAAGFARNGYDLALGRQRVYSGCHWCALPGREYTLNDCTKVNLASVFEVAFKEMMAEAGGTPSLERLWTGFETHLKAAVRAIAEGFDFHFEHMEDVFPELVMDLLCHGPVEKGVDVTNGGVELYNMCVDAAALATVADSFSAIEQRVVREGQLTWQELSRHIDTDWSGEGGERARLMMQSVPRYGRGGSDADGWAARISTAFSETVKESPTPGGVAMIPGLFSWAAAIGMGAVVGATPNGRHSGAPISHGANPHPGFRKDGAVTALSTAVASVQSGYGNTAPLQVDIDCGTAGPDGGIETITSLIRTHFEMGGTQINMNIIDAATLREALADPQAYPDLIVRVTGFSAYFASLSPEMRNMVVERIVSETGG